MADINEENMSAANATVALTLKSWDRFQTPNLRVDPSLLAAAHSFTHQGKSIKIALPATSEMTYGDRVEVESWQGRDADEQMIPANYLIHSVDVSVSLSGLHTLPSAVLDQPANAFDIIAPDQQLRLELLSKSTGQFAFEAFDLWIRCVRWKTGFARFGRAATVGSGAGWGTRLCDASTGKAVWLGALTFRVPARRAISPTHWERIGSALAAGQSPPLFVDLLFDAEMHIEAGDFRRAVIDAVVSAEAYIRSTVRSVLPGQMGEESGKFIAIRTVMKKLFPEALKQSGKPAFTAVREIHLMFNDRNKILHGGRVDDLSKEKCDQYVALVRGLIADRLQ